MLFFLDGTPPCGKRQKKNAEVVASFYDFLQGLKQELRNMTDDGGNLLQFPQTMAGLKKMVKIKLVFLAKNFLNLETSMRYSSADGRDCQAVGQAAKSAEMARDSLKKSHEFFSHCGLAFANIKEYYSLAEKELARQKAAEVEAYSRTKEYAGEGKEEN
jgi:hypothetical protein